MFMRTCKGNNYALMNPVTPAVIDLVCAEIRRTGLPVHHAAALHGIIPEEWDAIATSGSPAHRAVLKAEAQFMLATLTAMTAPIERGEPAPNGPALRWILEHRFPEHWARKKPAPPAVVPPPPAAAPAVLKPANGFTPHRAAQPPVPPPTTTHNGSHSAHPPHVSASAR